MKSRHLTLALFLLAALVGWLAAGLAPAGAEQDVNLRQQLAIGLQLLRQGAEATADQRGCFTCHHQALPVLTLTLAERKGFPLDRKWVTAQVEHSRPWLERRRTVMRTGRGIPGSAVTVGYELLMESAAGEAATPLTGDLIEYLLRNQTPAGNWPGGGRRPPSEGSVFTATALALNGLRLYASERPETATAVARAREWLLTAAPQDTEDHVFRLWALSLADAPKARRRQARRELLALQEDDGGWAQTSELPTDAYATGTALVALQRDALSVRSHAYRRGVKYLRETRAADGTWHVVKRARPVQTHFETGFPYGKDQFISSVATNWATMALLHTLADEQEGPRGSSGARPRSAERHLRDVPVVR